MVGDSLLMIETKKVTLELVLVKETPATITTIANTVKNLKQIPFSVVSVKCVALKWSRALSSKLNARSIWIC